MIKITKNFLVSCCLAINFCLIIFGTTGYCSNMGDSPQEAPRMVLEAAKIIDENVAQAKNAAISLALERGVQGYLVNMVDSQVISDNLDRLVQEILPKAKELVENYNIVAEQQIGDRYVVFVKVKVNQKLLKDRLLEIGVLQPEAEPIRLLFLVLEKRDGHIQFWWGNPDSSAPLTPAEIVLYRVFQERGFNPINRTLGTPESGYTEDMEVPELDNEKALRWGELFSADVVIWGQTEEAQSGEISVSLKATSVGEGTTICQVSQVDQGGQEAMEELIAQVVKRLSPCIKEGLGRGGIEPRRFVVTLQGLTDYFQFKNFRDFISKMVPGVKELKQRRIGSRFVSFQVQFLGSMDDFKEAVLTSADLPVEISRVEERTNEIKFILEKPVRLEPEKVND